MLPAGANHCQLSGDTVRMSLSSCFVRHLWAYVPRAYNCRGFCHAMSYFSECPRKSRHRPDRSYLLGCRRGCRPTGSLPARRPDGYNRGLDGRYRSGREHRARSCLTTTLLSLSVRPTAPTARAAARPQDVVLGRVDRSRSSQLHGLWPQYERSWPTTVAVQIAATCHVPVAHARRHHAEQEAGVSRVPHPRLSGVDGYFDCCSAALRQGQDSAPLSAAQSTSA